MLVNYVWNDSFHRWETVWASKVSLAFDILCDTSSVWWKYWLCPSMRWKVVTHGRLQTTSKKTLCRKDFYPQIFRDYVEILNNCQDFTRAVAEVCTRHWDIGRYRQKNRSSVSFTSRLVYINSWSKTFQFFWTCYCSQTDLLMHLYLYRPLLKLHHTVQIPNVTYKFHQKPLLRFDCTVLVPFPHHQEAGESCC